MFSNGATREKVVAVADIESGSAGVAIVKLQDDGTAEIVASERRALSLEDRTPRAAVSAVLALLSEAGEKALAAYSAGNKTLVSASYAVVHPPLCHSSAVQNRSKSEKEERVTEETIAELARTALSQATELDKAEIFESSVVRVELNGYPTADPVGKHAYQVEVSALGSACNQSLRTSIETTLGKLFPHTKPLLRSSIRTCASVVRDTLGKLQECVIVDMTADATAFISVDLNFSFEHGLMNEGYRTILKKISTGGVPEDTLSVLRMLERDDGASATSEAARTALSQFEPELLRECGEAMGALTARRRLPETLVLFVQRDFAPWLSAFFSRIDFTQFTVTMRPFQVYTLETEALSHKVKLSGGKPDAGLTVAAALVNREARG